MIKKIIGIMVATSFCFIMQAQQVFTDVRVIAERSNMRSDRRPIPVGYYDEQADQTFVCWMSTDSHPVVKAYNHATDKWSETKILRLLINIIIRECYVELTDEFFCSMVVIILH